MPADGLQPGMTGEADFVITDVMVPGHVAGPVLSTPSLVLLIERACRRSVLGRLDSDQDTVGTHICVSHEGVARVGENVAVRFVLSAVDRKDLLFEVSVEGPRGSVSRGSHRRRIVDASRFGQVGEGRTEPGGAS